MGLKLGKVLKKTVGSVLKRAPAIGAGFMSGGPMGAGLALLQPRQKAPSASFAPGGGSGGFPFPWIFTGAGGGFADEEVPPLRTPSPAVPTAGQLPAIIAGMNRITAMAIARLAAALGVPFTLASIGRVGLRLWSSMMAFARRHPGVSIIGVLTGLGLAADEAAHFLSWGATRKRRRRGRGISARDIRVCRRTMRKMAAFRRDLGGMAGPRGSRRRRVGGGGGGVVIAQQD